MRTSEINADAWAEGSIRSLCEVSGAPVDPWSIDSFDLEGVAGGSPLTICLPAEVMRFELGEVGVDLPDYKALLDFMTNDLREHKADARKGYLTYLRHILRPKKRPGLFGRLFSSPTPVVPIRWRWVSVGSVALEEVVIRITGTVVAA